MLLSALVYRGCQEVEYLAHPSTLKRRAKKVLGLDEGLISTTVAQDSFINEFGLQESSLDASQQANRLSNITSMVHIGSIPGALIAFLLCGRMGMLWSLRQLCILWLVGVIIVITSAGDLGQVYAGRFIMGLGIGQAGVVAPTYLAEIAPRSARGMLVSFFGMSEYVGIMVGVSNLNLWFLSNDLIELKLINE